MRQGACKVCSHPKRSEIDQMLLNGVSRSSICKAMGSAFGEATLTRHTQRHLNGDVAPLEVPEVMPEDLLGYGLSKVVATIARMDYLMELEPSPRNAEALNGLLGRLLDYDKAIKASQGEQDHTLEIRVIQALGPSEVSQAALSDLNESFNVPLESIEATCGSL